MFSFPETPVNPILKHLHEWTHYGNDALVDLIRHHLKGPHLHRTIQNIIQACQIGTRNKSKTERVPIGKGV